jgi:hypothetical protein
MLARPRSGSGGFEHVFMRHPTMAGYGGEKRDRQRVQPTPVWLVNSAAIMPPSTGQVGPGDGPGGRAEQELNSYGDVGGGPTRLALDPQVIEPPGR